jgi:hypothetical protein
MAVAAFVGFVVVVVAAGLLAATDPAQAAGRTDRDLAAARGWWPDHVPVVVVVGPAAVEVTGAGAQPAAAALAGEVAVAERAVAAAWGSGLPAGTHVVMPATADQAGVLAGQADLRGDEVAGVEVGDTVVLDPPVWAQLSAVGRGVTLAHELTHVVSRTATTDRTPTWLVEGLADEVGFAGSGLSTAQIAAELRARVRAGYVPAGLPTDAAYAPGSPDLAATYEQGWLACRLVVARAGVPGLVAFYREAGARGTAAALATVLRTTPAAFTAAWQRAVASLA